MLNSFVLSDVVTAADRLFYEVPNMMVIVIMTLFILYWITYLIKIIYSENLWKNLSSYT
jgi:pilus assembly protein TadC